MKTRMKVPADVAVYRCEGSKATDWKFWCPFCRESHHHGALEGPRVPHCTSALGLKVHGNAYYLVHKSDRVPA